MTQIGNKAGGSARGKEGGGGRNVGEGHFNAASRTVRDAKLRRRELRTTDPRVQRALDEAARQRAEIAAAAAQAPAPGPRRPARWIPPTTAVTFVAATTPPEEPRMPPRTRKAAAPALAAVPAPSPAAELLASGWTLGQARQLIRDGYRLERVVERTGHPAELFRDLVGGDGYVRASILAGLSDLAA